MKKKSRVEAFKDDIVAVYQKYNLAISHEDHHGSFLIEELDEQLEEWFLNAVDETMDGDE